MCYQRENINKTSCYNNCSHRFVNKTIGSSIRCQTGNLFDSFPQHLMLMHNGTYFAMNDGNVTSNLQDPNCKIGNIKFLFYNHSGKVQRDLGNWFILFSTILERCTQIFFYDYFFGCYDDILFHIFILDIL